MRIRDWSSDVCSSDLHVKGDELTADLADSSPQVRGAINSTLSFAKSAVYFAMRSIMDSDAPNNAGFIKPIHVVAPDDCIFNPRRPGAVAARGVSGFRLIDAIFGALADREGVVKGQSV